MISQDSVFLVSFFFGLASIPLFQNVAENYLDENEALGCTTVAFFLFFVFSLMIWNQFLVGGWIG